MILITDITNLIRFVFDMIVKFRMMMQDKRYFELFFIFLFSCLLVSTSCKKLPVDDISNSESEPVNLSAEGYANCYVASDSGSYIFVPTKGNSSEAVGEIGSVAVLWESYETDATPVAGTLIRNLKYNDGNISFMIPEPFKEGNAVIAAKTKNGRILWSWHIWITDKPRKVVYNNNAGAMMERNLGATGWQAGQPGSLGLMYQWGRKDPFPGSASISSNTLAMSSATWPEKVSSNSMTGTINYVIENPMTFVTSNSNNNDWYYTGTRETDNTRWTDSSNEKSVYDPCPQGWRVPDGGYDGVWAKAAGSGSYFYDYPYDHTGEGMNFSNKFSSAGNVWYPASGYISYNNAALSGVGTYGCYWTATSYGYSAYCLYFNDSGSVVPSDFNHRANAFAIRCVQE